MNQVGPDRHETCPDCGAAVLAFNTDIFSWPIRLEDHDLPITADLDALRREFRIWEHHGPRLGWFPKYEADRTWRPIRATHRCADNEIKHENKKEHTNV